MRPALLKALIASALAGLFGYVTITLVGYLRNDHAGLTGVILSTLVPMLVVFPTIAIISYRTAQLSTAFNNLEKIHQELQARSKIDYMTGLYNREAYFEMMRATRSRIDTGALLLIDADHFKNINDKYGHTIGDRALKLIAYALQNVTRKGDLVGPVGGEEFSIYLPGASRQAALSVAERIRVEIENTPFYITADQIEPLTVSIGGAIAQKSDSNSQIFSRADSKLYEAKNQGRNCVIFERPESNISSFTPHIIDGSKYREADHPASEASSAPECDEVLSRRYR